MEAFDALGKAKFHRSEAIGKAMGEGTHPSLVEFEAMHTRFAELEKAWEKMEAKGDAREADPRAPAFLGPSDRGQHAWAGRAGLPAQGPPVDGSMSSRTRAALSTFQEQAVRLETALSQDLGIPMPPRQPHGQLTRHSPALEGDGPALGGCSQRAALEAFREEAIRLEAALVAGGAGSDDPADAWRREAERLEGLAVRMGASEVGPEPDSGATPYGERGEATFADLAPEVRLSEGTRDLRAEVRSLLGGAHILGSTRAAGVSPRARSPSPRAPARGVPGSPSGAWLGFEGDYAAGSPTWGGPATRAWGGHSGVYQAGPPMPLGRHAAT